MNSKIITVTQSDKIIIVTQNNKITADIMSNKNMADTMRKKIQPHIFRLSYVIEKTEIDRFIDAEKDMSVDAHVFLFWLSC
jgi:hypothetical protein